MEPRRSAFLLLAAGEAAVVLAGQVFLPAAVIIQILVPLVLFGQYLAGGRAFFTLSAVFGLFTVLFAAFLIVEGHTLLPLLALVGIAAFALFAITVTRYRIGRRFGGAV